MTLITIPDMKDDDEPEGGDICTLSNMESLRRWDILVMVVLTHLELKFIGYGYKFDCPFCEGDEGCFRIPYDADHYECDVCGAAGDVVQFLIEHMRMSFGDAVEHLKYTYGISDYK